MSHRRVCNLSDPEATSGEQFQNDMLWVRGFTGFNVDGTQIHLKKKYAVSQKKLLNHVDGVSPVAVIKSRVPGISPATINVVPGNLHREIEEK